MTGETSCFQMKVIFMYKDSEVNISVDHWRNVERIDQCVNHSEKNMFWDCFTYYGLGSLNSIEGMIYSSKYIEFLTRKFIPELAKTFPDGDGTFQQAPAPCHTSHSVSNFLHDNNVKVLD